MSGAHVLNVFTVETTITHRMDEALRMAKQTAPARPEILALHSPPFVMADVSIEKTRGAPSLPPER